MSFPEPRDTVPPTLSTDEFTLRPITAEDAARDFAALMDTRENLRLWSQSTWPEDDFTIEQNRADLAGMEARFGKGRAFDFTVLDPTGEECLGCVYIFSTAAKFLQSVTVTRLGDYDWNDVDGVVYFWVRGTVEDSSFDARLLATLRDWFDREWPFTSPVFVVSESFAQQIELFDGTDLRPSFEFRKGDGPGKFIAYG